MTTTDLIPIEVAPAPATLFGTDNPQAIIAAVTAKADALKAVVKQRKLYSNISGREYVLLEGWTLLGTLLGVFPVCEWTRQLPEGLGWEARVEAKTLDGRTVGAAEAQCTYQERNWNNRDDYALRSMAQTRATAKALRIPLGFVMSLAGYESTPTEEMDGSDGWQTRRAVARQTSSRPANVDQDGVVTDKITQPTANAIAEAYHKIRQARGNDEFKNSIRPEMQELWPHAFLNTSNRLAALTEAEAFDVLAFLHDQMPDVDEPADTQEIA